MTTQPDATVDIRIDYEAAVPTAGGPDAADFHIQRPGQASLECALYLALDARQRFQDACGPLDDDQIQALIRALANAWYPTLIQQGVEPPAIYTIRARDLDDELLNAAIDAAGLSRIDPD